MCFNLTFIFQAVCVVYDLIHSKVNKSSFKDVFSLKNDFIIRSFSLAIAGTFMLYIRLYVMNFEGPLFTKADNPAAFAENSFSRVIFLNNSLIF